MTPLITTSDIARLVRQPLADLQRLARAAPMKYVKRIHDGRVLSVPDDELKTVQRAIYRSVLRPIPSDACVHSGCGRSILTNARLHLRHPYLSTFDIQQCFPSISPYRVAAGLRRAGFAPRAASLITRLTTVDNQLPQGAPTSPALLNLVLVDLDGKLASMARGAGLSFTRYVDDLYLSGGPRTPDLARVVEHILRDHKFQIKPSKRFDWGPHDPHTVTKIIVNTKPNPLPEYVASVRTLLENHRSGVRRLAVAELESVQGKVKYVGWINRETGARLEREFFGTAVGG